MAKIPCEYDDLQGITTRVYDVPSFNITAGTIGTWVGQALIDIGLTGYTPIGCYLSSFSHPASYNITFFMASNKIRVHFFRTNTSAYTVPEGDAKITVLYKKND